MKIKKYLIPLLIIVPHVTQAQQVDRTTVCAPDTILIDRSHSIMYRQAASFEPYRVVECRRVGRLGLRLDFGYLVQEYRDQMRSWLGNNGQGIGGGLAIVYHNWNLGLKFRVGTARTTKPFQIGDHIMEPDSRVNMARIDYSLGYSFNLPYNFAIEPYVALGANRAYLLGYDSAKPGTVSDKLGKLNSLVTGITANKYFKLRRDNEFVGLFVSYEYNHANFKKLHPELSRGNTAFNFGILYKAFAINRRYHRVD